MSKIVYAILAVFCFQHLVRDFLQQRGVNNWYTTFGHSWLKAIADTPRNNRIGMLVFFLFGCLFTYLALRG